jgi:NAD(P)H-nitrite reductase large subunit
MRRYVILGSGAAGMTAAETLRESDPSGQISLVTEDPAGYYTRPGLAYYLNGEIDEGQLFPYQREALRRLRIDWVTGEAVALNPAGHYLQLQNGRAMAYDRLLLATGADASLPQLPGIQLEGVVKLYHLEDARRILNLARRGKNAVVIGGGITSLELVEGLMAHGMRVHYLMRSERFWNTVLDPVESRMVEDRLKADGATLHTHTEVREILGDRKVSGICTQDGQTIPSQIAAFATGIRPRTGLANQAGIACRRGILVDEYLRTSAADIFSAGDAAELVDPSSGESVMESLWNPARAQGKIAGRNLAGDSVSYRRARPLNVTRLAGLVTTIIGQVGQMNPAVDLDVNGIIHGDSEVWRQGPNAVVAQAMAGHNRLRLYVGEHTLLGAVIMGDQALSRPLQHLIEAQADITSIRARLLTPGINLAEVLLDFERNSISI